MKRIVASIGAILIVLALSSMAFGQKAERATRPARESAVERPGAEQMQQAQKLQQQIEEMKAAHQSLIDELNAIRTTATKERARQTVKQIETLISQRQAAFQETLRELEQQQQQLQRAARNRMGRPAQVEPRARKAPEFEMDSFDGRQVKLANYKEQIVVLEWLNLECPHSRYHYDTVQTMVNTAKKYRDKGVIWLAVISTFRTTPEANREFAEKHKLPYPILDDRAGELARKYGARTTPHVFIIDTEGRIAYDGAIDNAPLGKQEAGAGKLNYVDQALSELTQGRKVSLPNTVPYGTVIKYGRP